MLINFYKQKWKQLQIASRLLIEQIDFTENRCCVGTFFNSFTISRNYFSCNFLIRQNVKNNFHNALKIYSLLLETIIDDKDQSTASTRNISSIISSFYAVNSFKKKKDINHKMHFIVKSIHSLLCSKSKWPLHLMFPQNVKDVTCH